VSILFRTRLFWFSLRAKNDSLFALDKVELGYGSWSTPIECSEEVGSFFHNWFYDGFVMDFFEDGETARCIRVRCMLQKA
jgi:hypothetical protein